jgi:hypothetical protein
MPATKTRIAHHQARRMPTTKIPLLTYTSVSQSSVQVNLAQDWPQASGHQLAAVRLCSQAAAVQPHMIPP